MKNFFNIVAVPCNDGVTRYLKEDPRGSGRSWLVEEIDQATRYDEISESEIELGKHVTSSAKYNAEHIKENIAGIYRDSFETTKIMRCTAVTTFSYEEI